jgi:hypothetical protein
MANILFHAYNLGHRGGTNSLRDYAYYNETVLGNKSTIVYHNPIAPGYQISHSDVIESLSKRFEIIAIPHDSNLNKNMNELASKYDFVYSQRCGITEEPLFTSTRFGVHSAFGNYTDQCDVFAYISKYLSEINPERKPPYVPYMIDMPAQSSDIRERFGISKDQFVFGRIGGECEFDIEFVHETIKNIVNKRNDIVFLLVNAKQFYEHKNIIHVDAFFDQQFKSDFINSCDAMLHARAMGETFGLAIMEFLYFNKPVLAWEGGNDTNHVGVLQNYDLLYNNSTIEAKINDLVANRKSYNFESVLQEYKPLSVINKFKEVFLS